MESIIEYLFLEWQQTEELKDEEETAGKEETALRKQILDPIYKADFKRGSYFEDLLVSAFERNQFLGFRQGFKLAMRLKEECK